MLLREREVTASTAASARDCVYLLLLVVRMVSRGSASDARVLEVRRRPVAVVQVRGAKRGGELVSGDLGAV